MDDANWIKDFSKLLGGDVNNTHTGEDKYKHSIVPLTG